MEDTATGEGGGWGESTAINGTTASQRFITAISFINYPRRWLGGGGDVSLFMQIGRRRQAEAGCAGTGGSLFIIARRVASGKEYNGTVKGPVINIWLAFYIGKTPSQTRHTAHTVNEVSVAHWQAQCGTVQWPLGELIERVLQFTKQPLNVVSSSKAPNTTHLTLKMLHTWACQNTHTHTIFAQTWSNYYFIHSKNSMFIEVKQSRHFPVSCCVFFLLFNAATFTACDLIATRVGGGGEGENQIKIPLYYPAVGMPLAGIRARLRSSAHCVLCGLPSVHKRNYSDRREGDTKRPSVPVGGTEEDRTAPSGPHPEWEPSRKPKALERCTPSVQFSATV